jgi:hypothetical protein
MRLPKLGMEPKDWVTTILSAAAIVVSIYTFYATDIEVKDDVRLRIVRWGLDPGLGGEDLSNLLGLTVAIVNAGNRQVVLMKSQLTLVPRDKSSGLRIGGGEASKNLPVIIEPKKVSLLTPRMDISSASLFVRTADRGANSQRLYTLTLDLDLIDSTGRLFSAQLPVGIVGFDLQLHHYFVPLDHPGIELIRLR